MCTTEKHIQNFTPHIVPGKISYAQTVKLGRKIYVVSNSRIKHIRRDNFNEDLFKARAFSNPSVVQIPSKCNITSYAVIIYVRTNDIIINNSSDAETANEVLKIAKSYKASGVNPVFISSILVKKNPRLSAAIRRVNDQLRDMCARMDVHFIDSNNITSEHL